MIVAPTADLELAVRAIVFARRRHGRPALHVAAAPDRPRERSPTGCSTRLERRTPASRSATRASTARWCGPLISADGVRPTCRPRSTGAAPTGGQVTGGELLADGWPRPTTSGRRSSRMPRQTDLVREETFAPLLYVMTYPTSTRRSRSTTTSRRASPRAIFTGDLRESRALPLGAGSDCGIANVNIGPSGAEIGGAFGGEKETGGGRESGSDSWKAYMRRQTATINYSTELPARPGDRLRRGVGGLRPARSPRAASRRGGG